MAFVTGLLLVDAPASALNNAGSVQGTHAENVIEVKQIRTREGTFPYVSAQAFRYWLRHTLSQMEELEWKSAPIRREGKIAYTDADPIEWFDDDLFGYMRAPSKRADAREQREAKPDELSPVSTEITRAAPFRVSTLVSLAPVNITHDFGTMSRQEGDPVPHEHQFYRATLKGLFSLNLSACGTFSYRDRSGFRNLDDLRIKKAEEQKLEHLPQEKRYRLPRAERLRRITALFEGLAHLEGGAKLTIHYTDVMPPLAVMAVTKGGNHIFNYIVGADNRGKPHFNIAALREVIAVHHDTILSPIYVGWTTGYLDDQRETVTQELAGLAREKEIMIDVDHPRHAFRKVAQAIAEESNAAWLE